MSHDHLPDREPGDAATGLGRHDAELARAERDLRRLRRLELPTILGIGALGILVGSGWSTHIGLGGLGAWLVALAVLMFWARRVRDRAERGEHASGPAPRAERIFGEPAVAFRAPLARIAPVLAVWALLAAPLIVLAVVAFVGGEPFLGVVLTVAGLWCLVPLMQVEAARVSAGGVWLTPTGVLLREPGLDSRIPWADLQDVLVTQDGRVHLRAHRTAGTIHRPAGKPWLRAGFTLGPQHAVVEAQWLAVDPHALARVIVHYRDSDSRRGLGSAEEQRTVGSLIHG